MSTPASKEGRYGFRAFGLPLLADFPLIGVRAGGQPADSDPTRLSLAAPEAIDAAWPSTGATPILERRRPTGELAMLVSSHPDAGFEVQAPGYGRFLVSADGKTILCAVAEGPDWRWHRPLYGQVVPIAAALRGHELFHASGVSIDGRVVGFVGPSGTGKSSTAIQLVALGGTLFADDVLSLEADDTGVRAHPGTPFANIAREQLASVDPAVADGVGRLLGESDKLHIELAGLPDHALPLAALYFLWRSEDVPELSFEVLDPPDPALLLTATFLPHLAARSRLVAHLEACSRIAAGGTVVRMHAPASVAARDLAAAVRDHARSLP